MVIRNVMVSWNQDDTLTVAFEKLVCNSHQKFFCLTILAREFTGEVGGTSFCTIDKIAADDTKRGLRDRRVVLRVTLLHISDKGFQEWRIAKFIGQIAMQIRDMENRKLHLARLPQ